MAISGSTWFVSASIDRLFDPREPTYNQIHAVYSQDNNAYSNEVGFVYWPVVFFQNSTELYMYNEEYNSIHTFISFNKSEKTLNSHQHSDESSLGRPVERSKPWRYAKLLGIPNCRFCLVHGRQCIPMKKSPFT